MRTVLISADQATLSVEPRLRETDKREPLLVTSEALLGGRRQLIIQHGGVRYRLMVTRSNKLILTK